MSLQLVMLLLFFLMPVIIYSDYKAGHNKCEHNSELILAITPLLAVFYSAQFLYALAMLMLLVLYGVALKIVAHKYRWVKFNLQLMKSHSIGSVCLALLGYGLYKLVVYVGSLFKEINFASLANVDFWINKINAIFASLNHWPYLVYGALIIVIVLATIFDRMPKRKEKDEFSVFFVIFIIPVSLVLPWNSDHFWWFLLVTLILMPLVVFFVYGFKEENKQEAKDIAGLFSYVYFGFSHFNVLFYWLFG